MRGNQFNFFDSNKSVAVADSNKIRIYDGSNLLNVKPGTQRVDLVGGVDSQNVTWSEQNSVVIITHSMNCIPIICVYTQNNELVQPDVMIIDANTFRLNFFSDETDKVYCCIINYGVDYGSPTVVSHALTTYVEQAQEALEQAQEAKEAAQSAAASAIANTIQLQFSLNEYEELIMTKMAGAAFDFDIDNSGNLIFSITM